MAFINSLIDWSRARILSLPLLMTRAIICMDHWSWPGFDSALLSYHHLQEYHPVGHFKQIHVSNWSTHAMLKSFFNFLLYCTKASAFYFWFIRNVQKKGIEIVHIQNIKKELCLYVPFVIIIQIKFNPSRSSYTINCHVDVVFLSFVENVINDLYQ